MKNPELVIQTNIEAALDYQMSKPNQVCPAATSGEEAYPMLIAVDFAVYYKRTNDTRFKDAAIRQATHNLTYITEHNMPCYPWYSTAYTRDSVCRDAVFWFYLYKLLGDISYLRTAEKIMNAFRQLQRVSMTSAYTSQTFILWSHLYDRSTLARMTDNTGIDPNQHMETSLAFALLYTEPMSTVANGSVYDFYQNPTILGYIDSECAGALSLQIANGMFWMANDPSNQVPDTVYHEYTLMSLLEINQLLPTTQRQTAINNGAAAIKNLYTNPPFTPTTSLYDTEYTGNNGFFEGWRTQIMYVGGQALPTGWTDFLWSDTFFDSNNVLKNSVTGSIYPNYWKHRIVAYTLLNQYFNNTSDIALYGSSIFVDTIKVSDLTIAAYNPSIFSILNIPLANLDIQTLINPVITSSAIIPIGYTPNSKGMLGDFALGDFSLGDFTFTELVMCVVANLLSLGLIPEITVSHEFIEISLSTSQITDTSVMKMYFNETPIVQGIVKE